MYCKYCAKQIEENAEICVHCGRRTRPPVSNLLDTVGLTRLRPIAEPKRPGLAWALGFCLSFCFCGPVGYLYLGQWSWFWVTLAITLVAYPLTLFFGAYVLLPFIFAFHQHQMAKELNEALEMSRSRGQV